MFSFNQIVGNTHIIQSLQNSIARHKISHAYIFSGASGLGKKQLANAFAKTIQCEMHGVESCNACISCVTFESGNHPDIFFVRATKTKSISIDDIREQVNHNTETKPYLYPYKIFIIENADTMTIGAQNALLKTLEEPPAFGIFLLLVENISLLLPTILSRCVTLKFKPIHTELVKHYLMQNGIAPDKIDFLSNYAQGNIGKALALANDEEFIHMRKHILNILANMQNNSENIARVLKITKELELFKERIFEVLDIFYFWYRDIYVARAIQNDTESIQFLLMPDQSEFIFREAKTASLDSLNTKLEAIPKAVRHLKQYANFGLVMDVMLLALTEAGTNEGE